MFSSIELLIVNWLTSSSGSAVSRRSYVDSDQVVRPCGADFLRSRLSFFGSVPARWRSRKFSISCSGAWTTTVPSVS